MENTKPENLSANDFFQFDIRTGVIIKAETIPKSKKLLKLEVNFGSVIGIRIILAGIAASYDTTYLPGTPVVAVLNLAPRTMFDVESHGMLLAGSWSNGKVSLVSCNGCDAGTEIG